MSDKGKLARYYRKKLWGRGLVARILDFLFLRAILFTAFYLWFTLRLENSLLRVLMSLLALCFVSVAIELGKSIRLERFIKHERKQMRDAYMKNKVLAMEDAAFETALASSLHTLSEDIQRENLAVFRKSTPLCADDLLPEVRSALKDGRGAIVLFSLSPLDNKALAFCTDLGVSIQNVSDKLLPAVAASAGFDVDDHALEEIQLEKLKEQKKRPISPGVFAVSRVRKYVLVAIALFALSFFVRYALYYRLMAGACLSFAAASIWLKNYSSQEVRQ